MSKDLETMPAAPEAPFYEYDTPFGKVRIHCRKDSQHFFCHVRSAIYNNEIKIEKDKLTAAIRNFLAWITSE